MIISEAVNSNIKGVTATTDEVIAIGDYKGQNNTIQIVNQIGASAQAAYHCLNSSYTIKNTLLKGYLGSLGEWQTAYNNKKTINIIMDKIGGTPISVSNQM